MLRTLVTTMIVSRNAPERFVHFAMEFDTPSIEALHTRLIHDGAVFGHRLRIEFLDDGRRVIRRRLPQIVGLHGVQTISECDIDYLEADEAGEND